MHTLQELETICQKPEWRVRGSLLARRFARPAALYVTWFIGHWPINANAVTAISLMIGCSAAVLLAIPGCFVLGVAGLWCWYLLDHVDGQIARLQRTQSITGVYFDYMMHHLVHPAVAFALGYGLAQSTQDLRWSLAGAAFAFGVMALSLTNDCRYKAFFAAGHDQGLRSAVSPPSAGNRSVSSSCPPTDGLLFRLIRTTHSILLIAFEIPNVILCLTVLAACLTARIAHAELALRAYVLAAAAIAPTLAVLRLAKQVWNRLPDRDYAEQP